MATNPSTLAENVGRIVAPDANYPYGSAQDDSTGTTGDGTPIKKAILNDAYGFQQWLLDQTGIVPSGTADTVLASQYGDALLAIIEGAGAASGNPIGLILSNAADTDHDITVSIGQTPDSTKTELLKLTAAITKQIDAAWVAGDDVGGLFTGTVAASTVYAVFVIKKDSDGSIDAGFDVDGGAANIPAGYTAYRRVGWAITDSSANIINFTAIEIAGGSVDVDYDAVIADVDDGTSGTTRKTPVMSAPPNCIGKFGAITSTVSSTINAWLYPTSADDLAPTVGNRDLSVSSNNIVAEINKQIKTDSSSQIAYRTDVSASSLRIITQGYIDGRVD